MTAFSTTVCTLPLARHDAFFTWRDLRTRKVQKDLVQRRLADRIVLEVVLVLRFLHRSEDLGPGELLVADLILDKAVVEVLENGTRENFLNIIHQLLNLSVKSGFFGVLILPDARRSHGCNHSVALTKLGLQMLWAAQTFELAVHHDGESRTEGFTFLHTEETSDKDTTRGPGTLKICLTAYD